MSAVPIDEDDEDFRDDAEEVDAEPTKEDREDVRNLPEGLWSRLRADPKNAPQYLALAATEQWGEQAREYAAQVRREYPEATNQQLAKMVKSRHALLARMEGAAAGVPGSFAPGAGAAAAIIPDLGALAWLQSRMVVHIAAVYGHDTTSRDMAAELLVLQGFYNSTDAARIAVTEAGKRMANRLVVTYLKGSTLLLAKQLFRYVGIKFTRTAVVKAIPFLSIPLGAAVNETATRSLARRAIKFYDTRPPGKETRRRRGGRGERSGSTSRRARAAGLVLFRPTPYGLTFAHLGGDLRSSVRPTASASWCDPSLRLFFGLRSRGGGGGALRVNVGFVVLRGEAGRRRPRPHAHGRRRREQAPTSRAGGLTERSRRSRNR